MSDSRWQPARHVRGFDTCFGAYIRMLLRRSFASVWLSRDAESIPSSGYVACANHSSWWDGFIPYFLHHRFDPTRRFEILMSDRELRRFPFFRWGGAFSVDARSVRTAYESIRYAAGQARGGAAVWIFPQGVLRNDRVWRPFTSGFVHAARIANVPIVPVAMRFAMRDLQRPEVFVDIGAPLDATARNARDRAESSVLERLQAMDEAIAHDRVDQEFVAVLRANRGVDKTVANVLSRARPWNR
ncbi:MAG: lysophospholipid acyltransferase family protein [Candidatus Eremiobacteraeota bacterium]|nr:lysophospholipid acyltransferase family protein [Candidatus Eremiobacteraeota bacterium]